MGVERAVTRWYVQRQTILQEIARLETQLAQISPTTIETTAQQENTQESTRSLNTDGETLLQQRAMAQKKLHLLGPCPKPMMG